MLHPSSRSRTRVALAGLALTLGLGLSACAATDGPQAAGTAHPVATHDAVQDADATPSATAPARPTPTPTPRSTPTSRPRAGTALALLATLPVKGRAPMTGYDRAQFGQAWLDADRNGCDTRNDVLRRDVRDRVLKPGTNGCVVLSGTLPDPYTASEVPFERGYGNGVDIDHVVALGNAWVTGAARWDVARRAALANDPLNLLAVDMHTNRQKGDGDAATWLPPAKAFRCAYVARQVTVKAKYDLAVTPAERDAVRRVLGACPGQPATPDPTHAPTRVDQHVTVPGRPTSGSSTPRRAAGTGSRSGSGSGTGSVSYANCDAVRAAGQAPLHAGDPGYSRTLDRDGDGTACEP